MHLFKNFLESKNVQKTKPWITKGFLTSIKKKQAMHKTQYVNGSRVAQLLYKNYCNVLTKTKNIAKKLYYHQKLGEYHNNPKKTWDILRTLLPSKSASKVSNCVSVNNASITDPVKTAEEFNDHFAKVGKSLAEPFNGS